MDVAGPKLRTGPVEPGPAVVKYRPKRDAFGRVEKPARIWLTPVAHPETPPSFADACIPVAARWLARLQPGDRVRFTDTRDSRRSMNVTGVVGHSRWAESRSTGYVAPGLILTAVTKDKPRLRARIGRMPPRQQVLTLRLGDELVLTRSLEPGRPARFNEHEELVSPARTGVTLPEFFDSVEPGQPIWFDDGRIGGIVSHDRRTNDLCIQPDMWL
jgi:pyruvate kinase